MTRSADFADTRLLDELTLLVWQAAAAITRVRGPAVAARKKDDQSPVTDADEAAQAILLEGLSRILPGVPVVAEEAGGGRKSADVFMLVDPLDGTREFVEGRDEFTINVAIVSGGRAVTGLIAAPALDLLWRGAIGAGAQRMVPSRSVTQGVAIRTRPRPAALRIMVSRSHADPETERWLGQWPHAERIACGSALKFCRLAEGAADIYPRLGPTSEWDIAAGDALLTAAGGAVHTPQGGALVYGRDAENFRVPGFIAIGDPAAGTAPE